VPPLTSKGTLCRMATILLSTNATRPGRKRRGAIPVARGTALHAGPPHGQAFSRHDFYRPIPTAETHCCKLLLAAPILVMSPRPEGFDLSDSGKPHMAIMCSAPPNLSNHVHMYAVALDTPWWWLGDCWITRSPMNPCPIRPAAPSGKSDARLAIAMA